MCFVARVFWFQLRLSNKTNYNTLNLFYINKPLLQPSYIRMSIYSKIEDALETSFAWCKRETVNYIWTACYIQYVLTYAWSDVWLTPSVSGTRNSVAGINLSIFDFEFLTYQNMTSQNEKKSKIIVPVKWTIQCFIP